MARTDTRRPKPRSVAASEGVVVRSWFVELPSRAETFLASAGEAPGAEAAAGRAQACLYRQRLERELQLLARAEPHLAHLGTALQAQDFIRTGKVELAVPLCQKLASLP